MESKFNIAVLIDGDNAQPKLIKEIIEEELAGEDHTLVVFLQ